MSNTQIINPTGTPVNFTGFSGDAVTPSDTGSFTMGQLFVGTGGDVAVKFPNQTTTVVFKNISDGSFLPIYVVQVLSTGTTGSDIVVLR